ncbi:class I SAM-dependent methyltransferase [Candidatus Thorarchaeota archaeon]|nr:MAG: class I SAM-dependent methyltransferase [Candidatus Thorarchaeota archaeon]
MAHTMDDRLRANRELWENRVDAHKESKFYDLDGFLKGTQTLEAVEVEELGDVKSKRLVHLMCHFGLDTLSLARLGADVTGVDFSEKAIALARDIAEQIGVSARFVCANVYDAPEALQETFDIVYTGGGVLCWLPDITKWAEVVASLLRPGGVFYIREFHPFSMIFDDESEDLSVRYPYFQGDAPIMFHSDYSYADTERKLETKTSYEWNHPISEIVNSLLGVSLELQFYNEFSYSTWQALPMMKQDDEGRWRIPGLEQHIPFMFSIRATKPV